MSSKLAWGILSTGRISGSFAKGLADSQTGELVAVASRDKAKADKFGDEYGIPKRHGSYEALLSDPDVQAVYISTPHPMHAKWAIKAADAGKHILCEKPITLNYAEATAVVEAARRNDVFLMEAFMYRCNPQTHKLVELIRENAIGEVRMIQAAFGFNAGFNPESRLYNRALGGGGILDVGCYPVSMSRLVAGVATGKPFANPTQVKAFGHIGEAGSDEWAAAVMQFPGDIVAQVSTSVRLTQDNSARIYGSDGWIHVPNPWVCTAPKIILYKPGKDPEEIVLDPVNVYGVEADTVAANIENRQAPSPAMGWDDTLGNMHALDAWRAQIGLAYDHEALDAYFPTVDHRPLKVRPDAPMIYGKIEGIDKPVSRIVEGAQLLGAQHEQYWLPEGSVMFDEFFSRGGNCFDTAYIYGGGAADRTLGQWIKNRGVREQVVVLAKGAHTPLCYPEPLTQQLFETLDRLHTDYVDLYVMHRDNEEVPVGEFIDVLNEHKSAGRIRAFGGSNWSLKRIEEANEYARTKGLTGMSVVNNNLSLARMVDPVWAGCISANDPESLAWFEKTQMPLMSWSSLARGFFVFGDRDNQSDPFFMRCWYSEDNFRRLDRARELAEKKDVEPVVIALAWVLNQPFPTFPLIGPSNINELRISLKALDVRLTPEEVKWLNLEA